MARMRLPKLGRRLQPSPRTLGATPPHAAPGPVVRSACYAPFSNLFLGTLGDVYTCCDSIGYPLGNIARERLPEIWSGGRLAALRVALRADDFSLGCGYCERRITGGLRPQARFYDEVPPDSAEPPYPKRIEFNISNTCNLQCTMCDGDLSSSIRIHREHRAPLPAVYGEEFFADIETFIPHLTEVSFTGGEPFLASENHRIWDLLASLTPGIKNTITTNGTQWNRRVEAVLDSLRTYVNVSVDGYSKDVYEAVRVGADRDQVFENIDRFKAYTDRVGTEVRLFHCLMSQNYDEFGDLLLYAERRGMPVTVHVVEQPSECNLERLSDTEWRAVTRSLRAQAERVLPELTINAAAFREQLERVETGRLRPILGEGSNLALDDLRR